MSDENNSEPGAEEGVNQTTFVRTGFKGAPLAVEVTALDWRETAAGREARLSEADAFGNNDKPVFIKGTGQVLRRTGSCERALEHPGDWWVGLGPWTEARR